jgi:hypothetical protein
MEEQNEETKVKLSPAERTRLWKRQNKDKVKQQKRRYREKHRDEIKEYHKRWYEEKKRTTNEITI